MSGGSEASDSPTRELLAAAVRSALDNDLTALIEDAGVSADELARMAASNEGEILLPVERHLERLNEARESQAAIETAEAQSRLPPFLRFMPKSLYLRIPLFMVLPAVFLFVFRPLAGWEIGVFLYLLLGAAISVFLFDVGGADPSPELEVSRERVAATEAAFGDALVQEAVRPWIRQQINNAAAEVIEKELRYEDATGLAEVNEADAPLVITRGLENIRSLMAVMPGGTIGISGPRGAGKSTLIRQLASTEEAESSKTLSVLVDAPVQYDGREFSLHLFGRLCEAVLGPTAVEALRDGYGPSPMTALLFRWRVPLSGIFGGLLLLLTGFALFSKRGLAMPAAFLGVLLESVGAMIAAGGSLLLLRQRSDERRRTQLVQMGRRGKADTATAIRHLRDIWFQQSFSSGWSGSLSLPLGLKGGVESGWELAQYQRSFPDVVSQFRDFLELITAERKVLIGIDELDKMDDEMARKFLNEIKGVFRVKGCYFFVSVSDDAISEFEQRGMPFRDAFDSAFDEMLALEPFAFTDSTKLIRDRVVGLPLPFIGLAHVLSAGLPRELIRVARALIGLPQGLSIGEASRRLSANSIEVKARAVQHWLGQTVENQSKAELLRWVREQWTPEEPVEKLRGWCDRLPIQHLLVDPSSGSGVLDARSLSAIRDLNLLGNFSLTTIELFDRFEAGALNAEQLLKGRDSVVEELAVIRQAFSLSRGIARAMMIDYLEEQGMALPGVQV